MKKKDNEDKDLAELAKKVGEDQDKESALDLAAALQLTDGTVYKLRDITFGPPTFRTMIVMRLVGDPLFRLTEKGDDGQIRFNWHLLPLILAVVEMTTTRKQELKGKTEDEIKGIIQERAEEIADGVPVEEFREFREKGFVLLLTLFRSTKREGGKGAQSPEKFPPDEHDRDSDEDSENDAGSGD